MSFNSEPVQCVALMDYEWMDGYYHESYYSATAWNSYVGKYEPGVAAGPTGAD